MKERCGIAHQIKEITCVRRAGHDGLCWSSYAAFPGGILQRAEWQSKDGKFHRHLTYRAFYPRNAR
jgi:hypothetical protein